MMSMKLSNIATLNVNGINYQCIIKGIKFTVTDDLNEKRRAL